MPALLGLLDDLPPTPPDGPDVQAYATAHGFYCRVARTCEAILLLVDHGLASEAAPLRRATLEHVLSLAWVLDEGPAAVDSLVRVHQRRMASIQQLIDDRWSLDDAAFERLLSLDVPSAGQDHLAGFGHLVKRYELSDDLLVAWLSDTGESHPSYLTARIYWHDGGRRLATVADEKVSTDVHAVALMWWMASCQMGRVLDWTERLEQIGAEVGLPILRLERKPATD